jgi:hypothetical protein
MKYKLIRQTPDPEIYLLVSRELIRQEVYVREANKKHLKEIGQVCQAIKKDGLPKNLICKKLPGKLGHGIFLHPKAKPILRGQIIAPYAGVLLIVPQNTSDLDFPYAFEPLDRILLTQEEHSRFDKTRAYHPGRFYSLMVDALKKGNFTRFINHSEKPNIVAEFFKIGPNHYGLEPSPIEVIYLAKKKIEPGEQLLVSYDGDNHSYWGSLKIKPIPITPKTFRLGGSLKLIGSIEH